MSNYQATKATILRSRMGMLPVAEFNDDDEIDFCGHVGPTLPAPVVMRKRASANDDNQFHQPGGLKGLASSKGTVARPALASLPKSWTVPALPRPDWAGKPVTLESVAFPMRR